MSNQMQKLLPVVISIAIIVGVAFLRDRFRTVAALLVTLPINIPLSMWIVSNGAGSPAIYDFARTTVIGLFVTLAWVLIVFLALRAGWTLGAAIAAAYGVWGMIVGVLFALRVLSL